MGSWRIRIAAVTQTLMPRVHELSPLSLGEISLWQNGVMDDEWWVCPSGANAQQYFSLKERQKDVEDKVREMI